MITKEIIGPYSHLNQKYFLIILNSYEERYIIEVLSNQVI